ncbi:protein-L-isoaspartate O-methyltransferase [candidate division WOR-1 bacterium RIFOXYA12_FULL_43_27]|uniref:Protein-L-isoaspartate O-methyltransferase n=1 Tax=candidate division WOR-1 bacterium RIFOXYC2_FULL_46_14 TaxID=1802587 RepID=A0A1F4U702_UNCSA|nr:MAG: protein-L-isoaspartate O-methyltransferase [candidate division WOR-1 bacterium RIFOXYA12_FULL_43_27]OGC19148.1 MAG: protein-L-isoaspartate O-methyltransferase [candidate division WOR-1 bacterium RIFOXYB2_FULL_46_45]OGC30136.1 MAG: protein-L-isoaspartate O-methyltransferase [candidate division WOR-1 bacterium RIFOXYA2_FULL_46_56]OGC40738.1 MAG: protein-L-isoaspartate O-methyltransferase [candidate division WOR-1 bacterium RIFOXYC2_FULL_46_14]
MVEGQLEARGIKNRDVLNAFLKIPREDFVPEEYKPDAYYDGALPIGEGQTISQPYMVALMTELLEPKKHGRVLEIGTGSGYQAAILSLLYKNVITMERIPSLARQSGEKFKKMGYRNITTVSGDGALGYPDEAPYDGIIVTAAAPDIPPPLTEQLKDGGRLVIPVGDRWVQTLKVVEKRGSKLNIEDSIQCVFVPLVGRFGFE